MLRTLAMCIIICSHSLACLSQQSQVVGKESRKLALLLLGRPLTNLELLSLQETVDSSKTINKRTIVERIIGMSGFQLFVDDIFRSEYLQGALFDQIESSQLDFDLLRVIHEQSDEYELYQLEYNRLDTLRKLILSLETERVNLKMLQKAYLNNYIYDKINMGDDNFISSTFQYILLRKPTGYELNEGKKMYHNSACGVLLLNRGCNIDDYLNILLNSDHYLESQIRFWYQRLRHKEIDMKRLNRLLESVDTANPVRSIILEVLCVD